MYHPTASQLILGDLESLERCFCIHGALVSQYSDMSLTFRSPLARPIELLAAGN